MESFCTYTVDDFKRLNKEYWINLMEKKHGEYETHYPMRSFDQSQVRSWADCFDVLQRVLKDFNLPGFYLIFEYILYAENGARPDVLLVSDKQVFVLEFKRKNVILEADIAQADMYGRFLKTCHVESRDKEIITCLVVTELPKDEPEKMNGSVHIVSPEALKHLLEDRIVPSAEALDIQKWQQSKYEPDKNSVQRMVDMFKYGRLPHLKSAKSSKIPVATDLLVHLTERAKANHEHWLCFVSGVPGAGKTLLGIQYIYQMRKPGNPFFYSNATYVSGNGPLLKVLKGRLQYPDFMMGAQSFAHSFEQRRLNPTNLIVFDEAQRMWSEERMQAKYRGNFSENQQIIHIAGQTPWGVLVALVGEGQEIYAGEDGQQRLTALLSALYGIKVKDANYQQRAIRISFNPLAEEFAVWTPAYERNPEWISSISELFEADYSHEIPRYRKNYFKRCNEAREKNEKPKLTDDEEEKIETNINSVLDLLKYQLTELAINSTADEEDVTEIFVRTNSGGQKLTENNFIETLLAVYDRDVHSKINSFCEEARLPQDGTSYNVILEPTPSHLIRMAVGLGFRRARLRYAYMLLRGKDLETGVITSAEREENLAKFKQALDRVINLNNWHAIMHLFEKAGYVTGTFVSSTNAVVFSYVLYLHSDIWAPDAARAYGSQVA